MYGLQEEYDKSIETFRVCNTKNGLTVIGEKRKALQWQLGAQHYSEATLSIFCLSSHLLLLSLFLVIRAWLPFVGHMLSLVLSHFLPNHTQCSSRIVLLQECLYIPGKSNRWASSWWHPWTLQEVQEQNRWVSLVSNTLCTVHLGWALCYKLYAEQKYLLQIGYLQKQTCTVQDKTMPRAALVVSLVAD